MCIRDSYNTLILITGLIGFGSLSIHAQYPSIREKIINLPTFDDRFLHYGYFVGINSYDFKFSYEGEYYKQKRNDIEVLPKTGFNVGLIGDLRVNKFINIRIEPGLYYSNIGGVRIEDTVLVTKEGCKSLSKFPKFFEI